jgi:signal transduction protein with GAF and PtsI domain
VSSNSGAREAKNRPRNNIASSLHEKKKKTEVCTKIQKIEFEEVCSVYVLDLDFSYYLDGYVLGKLETSWQFLIG